MNRLFPTVSVDKEWGNSFPPWWLFSMAGYTIAVRHVGSTTGDVELRNPDGRKVSLCMYRGPKDGKVRYTLGIDGNATRP